MRERTRTRTTINNKLLSYIIELSHCSQCSLCRVVFIMRSFALASSLVLAQAYHNELDYSFPAGEEIKTPQPHTYIKPSDLPESLDYRAQGLLTTDLNQHIPVYCGSCWAHAAFSSLGDRLKIQSKGVDRDVIPSVQALINCGHAGSCNGGNSGAANRYVYNNGIPDVTCQVISMLCFDELNFMSFFLFCAAIPSKEHGVL